MITVGHWKRIGIVCGALLSLGTLATCAVPIARSDPPPLAGISRVDGSAEMLKKTIDKAAKDIKLQMVIGQIRGTWARLCEAIRRRDMTEARTQDTDLSGLQEEHQKLTGLTYPLRQCI